MKKSILFYSLVFLALPAISAAQSLQTLFTNIPTFINKVLIPFLFGLAFLIFVYNAIRFFVIEGSNEQGRDKAKTLAIYSVAAFVFLMIFFGLVNMLATSTGLEGEEIPCPDYKKVFGTCD